MCFCLYLKPVVLVVPLWTKDFLLQQNRAGITVLESRTKGTVASPLCATHLHICEYISTDCMHCLLPCHLSGENRYLGNGQWELRTKNFTEKNQKFQPDFLTWHSRIIFGNVTEDSLGLMFLCCFSVQVCHKLSSPDFSVAKTAGAINALHDKFRRYTSV